MTLHQQEAELKIIQAARLRERGLTLSVLFSLSACLAGNGSAAELLSRCCSAQHSVPIGIIPVSLWGLGKDLAYTRRITCYYFYPLGHPLATSKHPSAGQRWACLMIGSDTCKLFWIEMTGAELSVMEACHA